MRTEMGRRLLYWFIAIVMLFLGICFQNKDHIEAGSSFAYAENGREIPALRASGHILPDRVMCADEQLSAQGAGCRLEETIRVNERVFKRMKYMSLTEFLPGYSARRDDLLSAGPGRENRTGAVIISYVHNQDGAKSC